MAARDLHNNIDAAVSLNPAARTSSANGTGVDLSGYNSAEAIISFGAWTDGTHTPTLEESDASGSGYTTVAAADMLGTFTALSGAGGQNAVQRVGYRGAKRYLRVVMTVGGATSGALSGAVIVRGRKRHKGSAAV